MTINYNPSIVTSGLVISLDAANPRSYPGSGTTVYDVAGTTTHSLVNGANYTVLSGVKCFDCATSAYYMAPTVGGTAPILSTAGYTYVAWARMKSSNAEWRTLWRTTPDDHPLLVQTGGTNLGMYDNTGTGFNDSGYNTTPYYDIWAQWTVVGDTTNGSTFYINGSQVGTSVAQSAGGNYHKWIGGAAGSQPFGYIANCFLYNTKLTQLQINQNYQSLRGRFGS
jgi:hypothetical protein